VLIAVTLACACVPSSIGTPCSTAAPCPASLTCETAWPGGYCTAPCPALGENGSRDMSDFRCSGGADGGLAWAKNCFVTSHCRSGYSCRPVDGGAALDAGNPLMGAGGVCVFP
jgi:hypothetical protein